MINDIIKYLPVKLDLVTLLLGSSSRGFSKDFLGFCLPPVLLILLLTVLIAVIIVNEASDLTKNFRFESFRKRFDLFS